MKKEKLVQYIKEGETAFRCFVCSKPIDEIDLIVVSKKFFVYRHDLCMGTGMCFVCGNKFKPNEPKVRLTRGVWRHDECFPGSPVWLLKFKDSLSEKEIRLYSGGTYEEETITD